MAQFNFNPLTGLNDTNFFPAAPASEAAAREQFMRLFNQIKDYLNSSELNAGTLNNKAATDYLLKTEADANYSKFTHGHSDYAASSHNHAASSVGFSWGTAAPSNGDGKADGSIYYRIEG